jgi:hypothetical protein
MSLRFGAAAGAKDIAGQRAVLPAWRDSEGTGDCPLGRASGLGDVGFRVLTPRLLDGLPVYLLSQGPINRKTQSQDFSSVWFIVSGQSWVGF